MEEDLNFFDNVSPARIDEERPLVHVGAPFLWWLYKLMSVANRECDRLDAIPDFLISGFFGLTLDIRSRILCP